MPVDRGWGVRFVSTGRPARLGLTLAGVSALLLGAAPPAMAQQGDDQPPGLNTYIDPALLESLQSSIVGLVVVWEEPPDPWGYTPQPAPGTAPSDPMAEPEPIQAISLCTGWFDTPTTIVTAGHCVDPAQGRTALDDQQGPPTSIDPTTGMPTGPTPVRPEPKRTVWAYQPREMPGAVLTAPVIVNVDEFRKPTEGDTARLEMHGLPPGKPLPVATGAPRLGETVTSIGFPGLNISETDGVDEKALETGGKTPAEVLQDSRLQPVNTSGTITAKQYREGVSVYQVNADLASGISGGPTINSRGEVYGVNSQMSVSFLDQNFNIITDTQMLRSFLGLDRPPPPAAPSTPAVALGGLSGGASLVGWFVIAAAIAGALIGAVLTWSVHRLRRPAPEAGPADADDRDTEDADTGGAT